MSETPENSPTALGWTGLALMGLGIACYVAAIAIAGIRAIIYGDDAALRMNSEGFTVFLLLTGWIPLVVGWLVNAADIAAAGGREAFIARMHEVE